MKRAALAFGVIGAAFAAAAPACAQSQANAEASVTLVQVFSVARTQNLEFSRLRGVNQPGSIVIDPFTNVTSDIGGGGSRLLGNGPPRSRAEFTLSGISERAYHVTLPTSVVIPGEPFNGAAPIPLTANNFVAVNPDGGTPTQLDASGHDIVYVGATLIVPANAPDGRYSLALVITADYD